MSPTLSWPGWADPDELAETFGFVGFGSPEYLLVLAALVFARSMDFLSTWIATPNLRLEANPFAKWQGWRGGIALNAVLCPALALWPLPAIIISTTSLLLASRNFQSAWLMRTLGESGYRTWHAEMLSRTPFGFYLFCLFAQTALVALLGMALIWFSGSTLIPFAVGVGMIGYAIVVATLTFFAVRRFARRPFF